MENYIMSSNSLKIDKNELSYRVIEHISTQAAVSNDPIKIVNSTLSEICDIYSLSLARIIERPSNDLVFKCKYSSDPENPLSVDSILSFEQWSQRISDFNSNNIIFNGRDTIEKIPYLEKYLKIANIESIFQVPIVYHDIFLGYFEFIDFHNQHKWDQEERLSLQTILRVLLQFMYGMDAFKLLEKSSDGYDLVTGLKKYEIFTTELDENIKAYASSTSKHFALICTDIKNFKYINESYGYVKGNSLLKSTANLLKHNIKIISACRIHSDNFAYVFIYDSDKEELISSIKKMNNSLSLKIHELYPDLNIKFNTGIYIFDDLYVDAQTAYTNANLARKSAKEDGNQDIVLFHPKMMDTIRRNEQLNSEFADALKNKNLIVYYQPKISCKDESIVGGEALIRWRKDNGTFIYPDEFISAFERNGNIVKLDYYVYREVFSYIRNRIDTNQKIVPISMNVSRVHLLNDDIIGYITSLFDEFKIPPQLVEFELTENIYMSNMTNARKFMNFCKSFGIFVSMDDFGSGFSSLNVMNSLPIDIIKLDRVFLKNETLTENDKIVLECIISMAKRLKMKVICEGVETSNQSKFLKEAQCDMIQGYYYGRPMDEESFNRYIEEHWAE